MDLLEVASRRTDPGMLIFNHARELILFNPAASTILSKLSRTNGAPPAVAANGASGPIPREIHDLYDKVKKNGLPLLEQRQTPQREIVLLSTSEATYSCKGLMLEPPAVGSGASLAKSFHVMVLIERVLELRQIDFERLKRHFQLTHRQVEIIRHLFSGSTNKQIAEQLFVSEDTIKGHLKHIMRRLEVNSRTQIVSTILQF